jgi:hypothetical protein
MTRNGSTDFYADLEQRLQSIRQEGLVKTERVIVSPQGTEVTIRAVAFAAATQALGIVGHGD